MPTRLSVCDTRIERLLPDLQDVAAARWPCLEDEHPVVCEGHLARYRRLAPGDPPYRGGASRGRGGAWWRRHMGTGAALP
jgi:hypothetical protein